MVGFVQDEVLDVPQVDQLLVHQVNQTTRGRNQHIDATFENLFLIFLGDTAVNDGGFEVDRAGIGRKTLFDLFGKFTGGCQDEGFDRSFA